MGMSDELKCWKCGAKLTDLPLPLARRAECPACHAELHVCRMCRHYDTSKAKQCREPMAEEVKDKVRANFCEWFQPGSRAYTPETAAPVGARSALDRLFGASDTQDSPKTSDDARKALDDLFGGSE